MVKRTVVTRVPFASVKISGYSCIDPNVKSDVWVDVEGCIYTNCAHGTHILPVATVAELIIKKKETKNGNVDKEDV